MSQSSKVTWSQIAVAHDRGAADRKVRTLSSRENHGTDARRMLIARYGVTAASTLMGYYYASYDA